MAGQLQLATDEDRLRVCSKENIWSLFHRLWGVAKESPEYDKELCRKVEAGLLGLQNCLDAAEKRVKELENVIAMAIGKETK